MLATVTLNRLRIHARHGVLPQERTVGNTFEVSLSVTYDATLATRTDDIDQALSYVLLVDIVRREMAIPSRLLEHVAARIKNSVADIQGVESVSVTVAKLLPPIAGIQAESFAVTL